MGPHPAVAELRRAVRAALTPGRPVVVACSGGADSLALAAATAFVAPRAGVAAALATVDHGLQAGSALRARAVAALGYELGFDPVEVLTVRVGRAGGPEAAARTARYAALDGLAAALDADLLLAHTLDDQAETVLLGLGRGSGPRSLSGMRPLDGRHRRPLLGLRRSTTHAACAALGLPVWDDPHNTDPSFRRVRVRGEALPLLEDVLGGGVAQALARTAELARADADALDELADRTAAELGVRPGGALPLAPLPLAPLKALPAAVRTRVLRRWAAAGGAGALSAERTEALAGLLGTGRGPVELPGGRVARRRSGRIELAAAPPAPTGPQAQPRE